MPERWAARLSLVLAAALIVGVMGAVAAPGAPFGEASVAQAAGPENARCIDVEPETGSASSSGAIRYDALVTDGEKVTDGGSDSCTGAPVADVQVVWVVEDDDPDAWISNQAGTPTSKFVEEDNAGPDSVTTQTYADGTTFIHVALDDPLTFGEGRYSAHFGEDVPEPGSDPVCGVPLIGFPCPGEAENEDDVRVNWISDGSTPSPTPSPSPTPVSRGVSLDAADRVRSGGNVTFRGQLASADESCVSGQDVTLRRRYFDEDAFNDFATATTEPDGGFVVTRDVTFNSEYVAVLAGGDACSEAISAAETVLAKAAVSAARRPVKPKRGTKFAIFGSVAPSKAGTKIQLQRKKDGRFVTIRRADLGAGSDFRFNVRAKFKRRVFRVRWPKQDDVNQGGVNRFRVVSRPR